MDNKNIAIRKVKTNNMTIRIKSVFKDKITLEKAMLNIIKCEIKKEKNKL